MHLEGETGKEIAETALWARETINDQGGIEGRQVELVFRDLDSGDLQSMARELLDNWDVKYVIGPETSDEVYAIAPEYVHRKKVLITPSATAGDITRDFQESRYIWRTSGNDIDQTEIIVSEIWNRGGSRVALICQNTSYGRTFQEWTGVFSKKYDMDLVAIRTFEPDSTQDIERVAEEISAKRPEYVVAVTCSADAIRIKQAFDRTKNPPKLFFSECVFNKILLNNLGDSAEGITGIISAPDPASGFNRRYYARFKKDPSAFSHTVYDASLLAIYGSVRNIDHPFEDAADSITLITKGEGEVIP